MPINGNTESRGLVNNGLQSRRPYTGQILLPRHKAAQAGTSFRRTGERYAECCVVEVNQFGGGGLMVSAGISFEFI